MSTLEIGPKVSSNPLSLKNRLPFNSKKFMVIGSIVGGLLELIYALITLYYLNNIKIYSNGLATKLNTTEKDPIVINITTTLKAAYELGQNSPALSDNIDKYLFNYLLFGLISIVCSFFGFAIRDTFKDWRYDLGFLIIYEALAHTAGLGSIVTWIYIQNNTVMKLMTLLTVHKVFFILSLVINCLNCIVLFIVDAMGRNNYFEMYPNFMREDQRDEKFKLKAH